MSFVTVRVLDKDGLVVPDASNKIKFSIEGPGEIGAADNGDPADMTEFPRMKGEMLSAACAWPSSKEILRNVAISA
ncbi:MAG: hypothetical protein ACOC1E_00415 [Marinilabiliaceae bacterium]